MKKGGWISLFLGELIALGLVAIEKPEVVASMAVSAIVGDLLLLLLLWFSERR